MRTPLVLLALLAVLAAGCPAEGDACRELTTPQAWTGEPAPAGGDGRVPTDTLIWLTVDGPREGVGCLDGTVALADFDGDAVALEPAGRWDSRARALLAWRPASPLDPATDYELRWSTGPDGEVRDSGVVSFHTDDGPAGAPPEQPELLAWELEVGPPTLAGPQEQLDDYDDWMELQLSRGRLLLVEDGADDPDEDGTVWRIGSWRQVWSAEPLEAHRTMELRFRALDLAGQVSPWSPAIQLRAPGPGRTFDGSVR